VTGESSTGGNFIEDAASDAVGRSDARSVNDKVDAAVNLASVANIVVPPLVYAAQRDQICEFSFRGKDGGEKGAVLTRHTSDFGVSFTLDVGRPPHTTSCASATRRVRLCRTDERVTRTRLPGHDSLQQEPLGLGGGADALLSDCFFYPFTETAPNSLHHLVSGLRRPEDLTCR
jgi:hypothetical protein